MKYTPKTQIIEAVYLDSVATALDFLEVGEFSAILRDGFHIVVDGGTVFAPIGECYLIRWPHGIDIMDKTEFETYYEESP